MLRKSISKAIKVIRTQKGLSQEKLATKAGLDRTYISGIERLQRNCSVDSLEKIIKALGVSTAEFFKQVVNEK